MPLTFFTKGPSSLKRFSRTGRLAAGVCAFLAIAALLFWFQPSRGTLADYVHSRSFRIPAIPRNLSGITYCPASQTLFMISNGPTRIYEATLEGRLIRQIDLDGFHDTEDIVYLEGHTFAVVEERRRAVSIFPILPATETVPYEDCRHIPVLPPDGTNTGLEGLAWDPDTQSFLVAKESNPRAIYAISSSGTQKAVELPALHNLPWLKLGDYAGLYFDRADRRVLILSRTSRKIKDYRLDGQEKGSLNLSRSMPEIIRAEGLTIGPAGDLYVCSEPDRVDVFTRPRKTPHPLPVNHGRTHVPSAPQTIFPSGSHHSVEIVLSADHDRPRRLVTGKTGNPPLSPHAARTEGRDSTSEG